MGAGPSASDRNDPNVVTIWGEKSCCDGSRFDENAPMDPRLQPFFNAPGSGHTSAADTYRAGLSAANGLEAHFCFKKKLAVLGLILWMVVTGVLPRVIDVALPYVVGIVQRKSSRKRASMGTHDLDQVRGYSPSERARTNGGSDQHSELGEVSYAKRVGGCM